MRIFYWIAVVITLASAGQVLIKSEEEETSTTTPTITSRRTTTTPTTTTTRTTTTTPTTTTTRTTTTLTTTSRRTKTRRTKTTRTPKTRRTRTSRTPKTRRTRTSRRTTTPRRPSFDWQQPASISCVRRGEFKPSATKWTTNYTMLVPPVKIGDTLTVSGVFYHKDQDKFSINLINGVCHHRNEDDSYAQGYRVALHVDSRFRSWGHYIAINSLTADGLSWGTEERAENPFKEGRRFNLKIRVRQHDFVIEAKGRKVYEYKHKMPIDVIRQVWLVGGAKVSQICWNERCNHVNGR
ncbi:hypothetical protein Q1695_005094 [Nippostrongylus brasiliensis]|nr:hypothetical protein Q1695_014019 [Nippostrongylus brasiliensis]WKY03862.1 hypothetical protein Q1695_005094 [Nippostrongylus brasiliensis]